MYSNGKWHRSVCVVNPSSNSEYGEISYLDLGHILWQSNFYFRNLLDVRVKMGPTILSGKFFWPPNLQT